MPIIYKKVLREMFIRYRSISVAILALTIGLWGVGTLLVSMHIMSNDLNQNFLQTKPAHIYLKSENFHKLDIDELLARPDIMAAEFRDKATLRVEVHKNEWLPLWLYSVNDFEKMSMGRFFKQNGRFPPAKGTILIERNNLLISDLNVGSTARVQSKGEIVETKISGIVFDPGQAPSTQDAFVYAYTDKENYSRLTGSPAQQRLMIRFSNAETKEDVKAKFKKLSNDFSRLGIKINSFYIPKFNEHPHQFQLNTLLYLNGIIGLLSFVMAMVLVSQLMSSIFTQQIRQIGIMKAIGASRTHIFKIYIAFILLMSLASILIGLPLAIITGKAYSAFVSGVINFDILTTQMPPAIYIVITLVGFVMPIIFSLPALLKGMNISVNDALSDYGIKTKRRVTSSNNLGIINSSMLSLSMRNIARRKGRMMVTMVTMALGVAIFLTGFNVRSSLQEFLDKTSQSMKYDLKVALKQPLPLAMALLPFKNIEKIKSIEGWVGGVGRIQSDSISTSTGIGIIATPFDSRLKEHDLMDGVWLTGSEELEFVANQQAALEFKPVVIGKSYPIVLKEQKLLARLVGVVREFDIAKIYLDLDKYNRLVNTDKKINSLMISLNNRAYDNVLEVKKEVEQIIEKAGMDVIYVMSQTERAVIIFNHLNIILTIILFLSLLVLSVSSMGMGSAMGINVIERTREIGVLRAIGATPKMVVNLFVIEGFIISVLSIFAGLLLALPMSALAANFFGELILGEDTPLDFAFSELGFTITLIVTLLFGYIASRAPANKATEITVHKAIAYE